MNRFVWNTRYPDASKVQIEGATEKGRVGPMAPPADYQVWLTVGEHTRTQTFELLKDPRVTATHEDLRQQHALLIRIRDRISACHDAINQIIRVRRQVDEWVARGEGKGGAEPVSRAASGLKDKLSAIEGELIQLKALGDLDRLNQPARLTTKLGELTYVPSSADFAPTHQSYDVFDELSDRVDEQLDRLRDVIDKDVPAFVGLIHELEIPPIIPTAAE
jgi:hypothetical protein